jgi:Uma2 family endonuclease
MVAETVTATQTAPAPIRRRASYEEYLATASETRITEWANDEIIEYMPPNAFHQKITWFLFSLLHNFAERFDLGLVGAGPFEVKLWAGGPAREPDVFFLSEARLSSLGEQRFTGAPDLVVEVVSPGSVREDRVRKFTEYEQAGVREYWLVDPRPHQRTVECYRRDDAGVFQPVEVGEDGRIYSAVLVHEGAPFWLHVDWLWQEPLPKVSVLLRQIFDSDERFPQT